MTLRTRGRILKLEAEQRRASAIRNDVLAYPPGEPDTYIDELTEADWIERFCNVSEAPVPNAQNGTAGSADGSVLPDVAQ
jgi:hypothetical protein